MLFNPKRMPPKTGFFMVVHVGNADKTIDLTDEIIDAHETEELAIAHAQVQADRYDGDFQVFRCRPVRKLRATQK